MFCPKCGAENSEVNRYCQKCGAVLAAEASKKRGVCGQCGIHNDESAKYCRNCGSVLGARPDRVVGSSTSLEPNVAGLLCYLVGWITGLIFILIEKENKFVRFHAMQSIVTFGALTALWILFSLFQMIDPLDDLFRVLLIIAWILGIVLWIVLMIKAYQGERYKLPVAGDIAEKNS